MPKLNSEFRVFYGGEYTPFVMNIAERHEIPVIFGKDPYVKFGDFFIQRIDSTYYLAQNTSSGERTLGVFSREEKWELWKYEIKRENRCSIQ